MASLFATVSKDEVLAVIKELHQQINTEKETKFRLLVITGR